MKRIVSFALFLLFALVPASFAEVEIGIFTNGNDIQDMIETSGSIICATTGGVVIWDKGGTSYKIHTTMNGLPSNTVNAITQGSDGVLWCCSDKGIAFFDGKKWTQNAHSKNALVLDILATPDSAIWATDDQGVSYLKGGKWTHLSTSDGLPAGLIRKIARGNDGSMAFGSSGYGIGVFNGASTKKYTLKDGLPDNFILSLAMLDSNTIWVGTGYGAALFDGATWKTFTTDDGLPSNEIQGISLTPEGTVLFATAKGVSVYDGHSFTNITSAQGLADDVANAVLAGSDGIRWYGTQNGLTREQGDTLSIYRTYNVPASDQIMDSALAPDGSLWFATWDGVSHYANGDWTNYGVNEGLPDKHIWTVAVAGNGDVWAGSWFGGVSRFDGEKWTSFTLDDGIVSKSVKVIAIDADGTVWCGSDDGWPNGLCYYKNGKWTQVSTDEGLVSSYVTDIDIGPDNSLWVGTDLGVSRFDGEKWVSYTKAEGLPGDMVYHVKIFKDNTAIFVTEKGTVFFDGTRMNRIDHVLLNNTPIIRDVAGDSLENLKFLTDFGVLERVSQNSWNLYMDEAHNSASYGYGTHNKPILPSFSYLWTLTIDRSGVWWCGSYGMGIFTVDFGITPVQERNELPRKLSILGNYPNPFNPSTVISFSLPETGRASLAVYNASGQKIRELTSGIFTAGSHSAVWDGRDDKGRPVSSGVYISRLRMGDTTTVNRMTLVK